MTRFDLIAHTGVMSEYRGFGHRMRLSTECKRALRRSMPRDDTWIAVLFVLVSAGSIFGFLMMFARWWMCI